MNTQDSIITQFTSQNSVGYCNKMWEKITNAPMTKSRLYSAIFTPINLVQNNSC